MATDSWLFPWRAWKFRLLRKQAPMPPAWEDPQSVETGFALWNQATRRGGASYRACLEWAQEATRRHTAQGGDGPGLEAWLERQGIRVEVRAAAWSPPPGLPSVVTLRATLDLDARCITLYKDAFEATLEQMAHAFGDDRVCHPYPLRELILAHEVFHLHCPEAPTAVAEGGAHLFATERAGSVFFAGLLDCLTLLPKPATKMRRAVWSDCDPGEAST